MGILKILIVPKNNDLNILVDDKFCKKILNIIENRKFIQNKLLLSELSDIGYCGMVLFYNNSVRISVNGEHVIYNNENVIEVLFDSKKRINNILLKKAQTKYYKELSYYFKAKKYNRKIDKVKYLNFIY